MKRILTYTLLIVSFATYSQTSLHSVHPFKQGEKLSYIVSYSMNGLMTELAGVDMEVINVPGKKKPVYKYKFTAQTLTSWDSYVKIRHSYQTYVNANTLTPLIAIQNSDVKGNTTKAKYKFKYKSGLVAVSGMAPNNRTISKNISLKRNTLDIVSLIYKARTINYNNYKINSSIPYNAVALERSIPVAIKYLGKETIKVKNMGYKECYKIGLVLEQKFVVEPNATFMWITNDTSRVPVQILTVYKGGKALIKLNSFAGLND